LVAINRSVQATSTSSFKLGSSPGNSHGNLPAAGSASSHFRARLEELEATERREREAEANMLHWQRDDAANVLHSRIPGAADLLEHARNPEEIIPESLAEHFQKRRPLEHPRAFDWQPDSGLESPCQCPVSEPDLSSLDSTGTEASAGLCPDDSIATEALLGTLGTDPEALAAELNPSMKDTVAHPPPLSTDHPVADAGQLLDFRKSISAGFETGVPNQNAVHALTPGPDSAAEVAAPAPQVNNIDSQPDSDASPSQSAPEFTRTERLEVQDCQVPEGLHPQSAAPPTLTTVCSACGKDRDPDFSFCTHCGHVFF
jgi:hypothetical protein